MKKNWKLQQFDCLISWKEIYCLWWLQLWLILVWVFFVPFPILDLCWAYLSWRVRLLFFVCAALCFRRKWLTDSKNYKCVSLFWLWLLVIWFWLCFSTIFPISRVSEPTQIFGSWGHVQCLQCGSPRQSSIRGDDGGLSQFEGWVSSWPRLRPSTRTCAQQSALVGEFSSLKGENQEPPEHQIQTIQCCSWAGVSHDKTFLCLFLVKVKSCCFLFRQLFLFETQLFVSPTEDAYLAAVINEQGRQHQMGSPYDAEALASAARRVSQKDSGNLKSLNIRNGMGDAMWSLMYVFHDHIIPRATQSIVKKHDFADKRRVLSETLAFSKNPFSFRVSMGWTPAFYRKNTGFTRNTYPIWKDTLSDSKPRTRQCFHQKPTNRCV